MNPEKSYLYGPSTVPANATRLHPTSDKAISCPDARVGFEIDSDSGVLTNTLFDESKIVYDLNYCTSNVDMSGTAVIPTMQYLADLIYKYGPFRTVIDIGCGQGEFVEVLRANGLNCIGFDPVLKRPNEWLKDRFWTPQEPSAELFVMRCVLPHIASPWNFLESVWSNSPTAFVLVEYQRIEWIAEKSIFSQISHDHVHQFVLNDFSEHVEMIEHGTFAEGEWQWVLLKNSRSNKEYNLNEYDARVELMEKLQSDSYLILESVCLKASQGGIITVWGAGSKGAIFAYYLQQLGVSELSVVDSDLSKEGCYLENSGIQISSPKAFRENTEKNLVIVMNPRHVSSIKPNIRKLHEVLTMEELASKSKQVL
jgi:hypothetical protein